MEALADDKKNKQGLQRMSPGTGMEIVLHAARGEGDLPAPFEVRSDFVAACFLEFVVQLWKNSLTMDAERFFLMIK